MQNINNSMNNVVNTLSHTVSNTVTGLVQNPYKMEGILGAVRTVAPLTSVSTCNTINGILPFVERISSVVGMYSFLNKAQNYQPIQSLSDKPTMEKITSLISNGNIPITSILAMPLVKNNMDKLIGALAKNVVNNSMKNGNMNDLFSSFANQMGNGNSNGNNIDMSKLMEMAGPILSMMNSSQSDGSNNNNIDINAIMSMMQPFINSMNSNNQSSENTDKSTDDNLHNEDIDNTTETENNNEETYTEAAEIKSNKNITNKTVSQGPLEIKNRRRR